MQCPSIHPSTNFIQIWGSLMTRFEQIVDVRRPGFFLSYPFILPSTKIVRIWGSSSFVQIVDVRRPVSCHDIPFSLLPKSSKFGVR